MARVIKQAEIRRAEILDAAFKMFIERGFDNTSLNEIIAHARLSKGMFYHHFASKEALLEAIFGRITEHTYNILEPVISAKDVDPKSRLQQLLDRTADIRLQTVEFTREVFASLLRPESKLLYQRIGESWTERMRPVLTKIVEDGVAAGVFRTEDPEGVGDLILQMEAGSKYLVEQGMLARTARQRDAAAAVLEKRIKFHAVALSRILGLPDQTFAIGPDDFAYKFLKALNPLDSPAVKATQ